MNSLHQYNTHISSNSKTPLLKIQANERKM